MASRFRLDYFSLIPALNLQYCNATQCDQIFDIKATIEIVDISNLYILQIMYQYIGNCRITPFRFSITKQKRTTSVPFLSRKKMIR